MIKRRQQLWLNIARRLSQFNKNTDNQNLAPYKSQSLPLGQTIVNSTYKNQPLSVTKFKYCYLFSTQKQSSNQDESSQKINSNKQNLNIDKVFDSMNYYQILGLETINPNEEQIKAAYLDAVKKYHPDLSNDTLASQKFQIIQKAYQTLSNPQKRSQYRTKLKISAQDNEIYEASSKFKQRWKYYDKKTKDSVPDQWQFSYNLYKTHYQKVQVPKKNYKKYSGHDQEYWVQKSQIPVSSKSVLQMIGMVIGSAAIGSCAIYYIWN